MGNGTLDPRSLTSEERAWCDAIAVALCSSGNYSAAGAISEAVTLGLPERRAIFGEPASEGAILKSWRCERCQKPLGANESHRHGNLTGDGEWWSCHPAQPEPAKVECPNCGGEMLGHDEHREFVPDPVAGGNKFMAGPFWCERKPAQPEPVAVEMPEAVREAARILRVASKGYVGFTVSFLNSKADALESSWRTDAAQPAKVRMTKELRRALDAAEAQAGWHMDQGRPKTFDEIDAAIAAVRSQAAEAGKVRLPKVRELLNSLVMECKIANSSPLSANVNPYILAPMLDAALAELDAAEGKVAG